MDFSTTLGSLVGIRGEMAWRTPEDYGEAEFIPLPDLYYVVGLDKQLFGSLSLIAQYVGRYVLDWREIPASEFFSSTKGSTSITSQNRPVDQDPFTDAILDEISRYNRILCGQSEEINHGASLNLALQMFQDSLTLETFALMNFSTNEWMIRPAITYDLTDELALKLGAELYGGDEDTLFFLIDQVMSVSFFQVKISF